MGGAIFNMQGALDHPQLDARGQPRGRAETDAVPDPGKGIGGAVFNLSGTLSGRRLDVRRQRRDPTAPAIYNLVYDGDGRASADDAARHDRRGRRRSDDLVSDKTAQITRRQPGHRDRGPSRELDLVARAPARGGDDQRHRR